MENTILKLRKKLQLSQEEFANTLGVSKQTVQKWETGKNYPDIAHLMMLRERYKISIDRLIFGVDSDVFEFRFAPITPNYENKSSWLEYSQNLLVEYAQTYEEGKEIFHLKNLIESIDTLPNGKDKHDLGEVIFKMLLNAKIRKDYPYVEPSNWDEITALIDDKYSLSISPNFDSIKGAVVGRIAGCMLGKPVEGVSRDNIRKLLKYSNNYPIHRYIELKDIPEDVAISSIYCADYMVDTPLPDDDIDYTCLNKLILDKYGKAFTSFDVISSWVSLMPSDAYCTAERVAYYNFLRGYMPPHCATTQNPFREWIGAQIRADIFGYVNPGKPLEAAHMAYKDASVSHIKNGIYGEMFIAALLAIVAYEKDIYKAIKMALAYIPSSSRLFETISNILKDYDSGVNEEKAFLKVFKEYDDHNTHHWLHVICNASIVVLSLLYCENDFDKALSLAVSSGYDTDCNGATVGSIFGLMNGIDSIPNKWKSKLNGLIKTDIKNHEIIKIDDFVNETIELINKMKGEQNE